MEPQKTSSTEPLMVAHIWKRLPRDLFEAVLARLPFPAIFRFRCVCRNWNSLLASNSFSQHRTKVQQRHPCFYIADFKTNQTRAMYDPSLKKWHYPLIASLTDSKMVIPMASAGGLVCLWDIEHGIYVCNPLTTSFKELPPIDTLNHHVQLVMTLKGSSTGDGYMIFALKWNGDYQVYDSVRNSWVWSGNIPETFQYFLFMLHHQQRGRLMAIGSTVYWYNEEGISSFDLARGVGEKLNMALPLNMFELWLAEFQGKIMTFGLVENDYERFVCVWEMQEKKHLKEVDRYLDIRGKGMKMSCFVNSGGLIMLSLWSKCMNEQLISYDVESRVWEKIPSGKILHGKKDIFGVAFDPCVSASVS